MNIRACIAAVFTSCLFFIGCSNMGGTGEETTNGMVMGSVIDQTGACAANTRVELYPVNYDPVKKGAIVPVDTTDDTGSYVFARNNPGYYNIQAVHLYDRTRALVSGFYVAGEKVIVSVATLLRPGSIKVMLPESVDTVNGYLYIPGTGIFADLAGASDFVIIDSVPAGMISGIYYSTRGGAEYTVLRYNVLVPSGDTVVIANPMWRFSRHLYLNTTITGAAVTGNVTNFPVLVRLTSSNFNFSQAQVYGEDIRFAKSDNTPLSYEIEQWDSANGRAEIWIKVDTVFGSDSSQYIQMFWRRDDVGSESNGAAVFDTANGFAGVWHMNELPAGAASIRDRTQNGYNGTPTGMNAGASVDGVVGKCLDFSGSTEFITLPAVSTDFTGGLTVCGWMKYRTFNSYSRLIDFGVDGDNNNNIVLSNKYLADTTSLLWTIWSDTTGETPLDVPNYFVRDEWIYVTGTYDGSTMYAYKNGTLVGSIANPGGLKPAVRAKSYIAKSNWAADKLYNGLIDELQISKTARSADWIKLSYMNQKAQDALVQFR